MAHSSSFQLKKWQKLVGLSKLLASTLERGELLKRIVEAAAELVGGKATALLLVDASDRRFLRVSALCSICLADLTSDRILIQADCKLVGEAAASLHPSKSRLCAPLMSGSEMIGLLVVYDPEPSGLSYAKEFLIHLADHAAIAVHNADLHQRLTKQHDTPGVLMEWITDGVLVVDTPSVDVRLASKDALEVSDGTLEGMVDLSQDGTGEWGVLGPDGGLVHMRDLIHTGMRGVVTRDEEYILRKRDGTEAVALCNTGPVKDETGNITSGVLAFRDISLRKSLEREGEGQKALLEAMFEHMPVAVMLCNVDDFAIVRANRAAAALFGTSIETMIGKSPTEYSTTGKDEHPLDACRRAIAEKTIVDFRDVELVIPELGVRHLDGFLIPILSDATDSGYLLIMAIDVSDHVSAKEELERARSEAERRAAEMEAVISNMAEGVTVTDPSGNILLHNETARRILPWDEFSRSTRKRHRGANLRHADGSYMTPKDTPIYKALHGGPIADTEYLVNGASGPDTVIRASVAPIRDEDGKAVAAVSVFRDITQEKEMRRKLQESYEREHKIAEMLQRAFLPSEMPSVDGWEIAAAYRPALDEARVGGDVYDVFHLSDGRLGLLMADVSGKGLKAASHGATVRYMLRGYALETPEPAEMMRRLAASVAREVEEEDFVTAFYGILDPQTGHLVYSNAGHEPPLHICAHRKGIQRLDITGRALGVFPSVEYLSRETLLRSGDSLVLYTDGVTDARHPKPRMQTEGFEGLLEEAGSSPPQELVDKTLAEVYSRCDSRLSDDVALVILRCTP